MSFKSGPLLLPLLLLSSLAAGQLRADELKVTAVADPLQVKAIVSSISAFEKGQMVETGQIVSVTTPGSSFLVVPATYAADKIGGCHLYLLSPRYQLNDKLPLWINDDSQACDAVLSVFGCRLSPGSGIVVMVGIRSGERRQPQSLFLQVAGNGGLAPNVLLTRQLAGAESAFQARQQLGCLK